MRMERSGLVDSSRVPDVAVDDDSGCSRFPKSTIRVCSCPLSLGIELDLFGEEQTSAGVISSRYRAGDISQKNAQWALYDWVAQSRPHSNRVSTLW